MQKPVQHKCCHLLSELCPTGGCAGCTRGRHPSSHTRAGMYREDSRLERPVFRDDIGRPFLLVQDSLSCCNQTFFDIPGCIREPHRQAFGNEKTIMFTDRNTDEEVFLRAEPRCRLATCVGEASLPLMRCLMMSSGDENDASLSKQNAAGSNTANGKPVRTASSNLIR